MLKLNAGKYASAIGITLPLTVKDNSSLIDYLRLFISSVCDEPYTRPTGTLLNILPRAVVASAKLTPQQLGQFEFTMSAEKGLPSIRYDLSSSGEYPESSWVVIDEYSTIMPPEIRHLLVSVGFGIHVRPDGAMKDPLYRYSEADAPWEACFDCRTPSMTAVDYNCGSKIWDKIKPIDSKTLYGELCLTCAVNRIQAYNRLNPKDVIYGASFSVNFN